MLRGVVAASVFAVVCASRAGTPAAHGSLRRLRTVRAVPHLAAGDGRPGESAFVRPLGVDLGAIIGDESLGGMTHTLRPIRRRGESVQPAASPPAAEGTSGTTPCALSNVRASADAAVSGACEGRVRIEAAPRDTARISGDDEHAEERQPAFVTGSSDDLIFELTEFRTMAEELAGSDRGEATLQDVPGRAEGGRDEAHALVVPEIGATPISAYLRRHALALEAPPAFSADVVLDVRGRHSICESVALLPDAVRATPDAEGQEGTGEHPAPPGDSPRRGDRLPMPTAPIEAADTGDPLEGIMLGGSLHAALGVRADSGFAMPRRPVRHAAAVVPPTPRGRGLGAVVAAALTSPLLRRRRPGEGAKRRPGSPEERVLSPSASGLVAAVRRRRRTEEGPVAPTRKGSVPLGAACTLSDASISIDAPAGRYPSEEDYLFNRVGAIALERMVAPPPRIQLLAVARESRVGLDRASSHDDIHVGCVPPVRLRTRSQSAEFAAAQGQFSARRLGQPAPRALAGLVLRRGVRDSGARAVVLGACVDEADARAEAWRRRPRNKQERALGARLGRQRLPGLAAQAWAQILTAIEDDDGAALYAAVATIGPECLRGHVAALDAHMQARLALLAASRAPPGRLTALADAAGVPPGSGALALLRPLERALFPPHGAARAWGPEAVRVALANGNAALVARLESRVFPDTAARAYAHMVKCNDVRVAEMIDAMPPCASTLPAVLCDTQGPPNAALGALCRALGAHRAAAFFFAQALAAGRPDAAALLALVTGSRVGNVREYFTRIADVDALWAAAPVVLLDAGATDRLLNELRPGAAAFAAAVRHLALIAKRRNVAALVRHAIKDPAGALPLLLDAGFLARLGRHRVARAAVLALEDRALAPEPRAAAGDLALALGVRRRGVPREGAALRIAADLDAVDAGVAALDRDSFWLSVLFGE